MAGTIRMPLPMTFETTTAAASIVPSFRSRSGEDLAAAVESGPGRPVIAGSSSEELPGDLVLAEPHPLAGALLDEELDLRVLELRVLQHLHARRLTGIAEIAREIERTQALAGLERRAVRRPHDLGAELLGVVDDAEDRVQLQVRERPIGAVLHLQRDGGDDLVLAVDDALVEPA